MQPILVQSKDNQVKISNNRGIYTMDTNFILSSNIHFADEFQKRVYVVSLHNDYAANTSKVVFTLQKNCIKTAVEIVQDIFEKTTQF